MEIRKKYLHLMFKDNNIQDDIVNSITMPYLHRGKKISRKLVFKYFEDLKNRGVFPYINRFFFEDSETCEQISYKYNRIISVQISIYSVDINDDTIWLRQ